MAVARDDLGGNRFGAQAQLFADMFLDGGVDVGERADRARDGAGRHFRARGLAGGCGPASISA